MTQFAPRTLILSYGAALLSFLALDACWLSVMGPRLYQPAVGHLAAAQVDWLAAALFYLAYIGGLVYFAVGPALDARQTGLALRRGVLLGLMSYATYDLTNQATLRDWPWSITLVDMAWGGFASGLAAFAAAEAATRLTSRHAIRRTSR